MVVKEVSICLVVIWITQTLIDGLPHNLVEGCIVGQEKTH